MGYPGLPRVNLPSNVKPAARSHQSRAIGVSLKKEKDWEPILSPGKLTVQMRPVATSAFPLVRALICTIDLARHLVTSVISVNLAGKPSRTETRGGSRGDQKSINVSIHC